MILITGATGHLGNVLAKNLLAEGEKVRALVLPDENCNSLGGLNIETVEGNVLNPESVRKAMEGVEYVYHLAAVVSIIPGAEEIMYKVNVEGVRNVARAALSAGVKRMVHTSSVHAFKREQHGITMNEKTPIDTNNPAGAYDRTKALGTMEALKFVDEGLDVVVACPTGIIGPYDYMGSEMGNVVLNFARKKIHFLINGGFDFVDVRDVAQGLIAAARKGRKGEIYLLSGRNIKIKEIREIAQNLEGFKSPALTVPSGLAFFTARFAELYYRITKKTPAITGYSIKTLLDNAEYCNKKARKELGYNPRSLKESIADTIKWHKTTSNSV